MKFFENRRVKGAISIFLVIITIPTMLFAAVLVDASRLASAKAMTQEAADLAAASALADYNLELKEKYGLFAMEDSSKAENIYQESLKATLLASGFAESEDYSEQLWEILKSAAGGGNPYEGKKFLNLFDFSVDSCQVTPKYSLAEWQVLENQMVEYAKFRGIFVMADRLALLQGLGEAQKEQDQGKETADVMEDKMDVDEENAGVDKTLGKLREAIEKLNEAVGKASDSQKAYNEALKAKMKEVRIESIETEETLSASERSAAGKYDTQKKELKKALEPLDKLAADVLKLAEKAKKEVEKAVDNLEGFIRDNEGKAADNEDIEALVEEAKNNIEQYQGEYTQQINSILEDSELNRMKNDKELPQDADQLMKQIDEAVNQYAEELEEMEEEAEEEDSREEGGETEDGEGDEEEEEEYYYYYLDGTGRTEEENLIFKGLGSRRSYGEAMEEKIGWAVTKTWTAINPTADISKGKSTDVIDRNYAKSQSEKAEEESGSDAGAPRGEIEKEVYQARPSKNFVSEGSAEKNQGFYNEDGDLSGAKEMLSQAKEDSMLQQIGETVRDDVLCLSYMFGTFKTRLTGVEKFSASGISQKDKDSFYMPKWRYAHEDGEIDMRFSPKKDRETVLRSEIEYLIFGQRTDAANENAVYAAIFAERLANNMIAVYGVEKIRNICHTAAAAASVALGGLIPETVFFWIFIAAWATAETVMDMNFLVNGGYRIPIYKNSKNVLLRPEEGKNIDNLGKKDDLISNYGEKGIFVSYEDYLLIMLLLAGQETRLMRSADLIEMNMKKTQSDFTMAKAYTYLHGKTELSTRYLFGSVMPFKQSYEEGGVTGRMHFTNEIYLGY